MSENAIVVKGAVVRLEKWSKRGPSVAWRYDSRHDSTISCAGEGF
jgi:hypothetical protein